MFRCLMLVALMFSSVVMAEEQGPQEVLAGRVYDVEQDDKIAEMAKNRSYLGGIDERDLTVQPQLPNPARKLGPTSEFEKVKPQ